MAPDSIKNAVSTAEILARKSERDAAEAHVFQPSDLRGSYAVALKSIVKVDPANREMQMIIDDLETGTGDIPRALLDAIHVRCLDVIDKFNGTPQKMEQSPSDSTDEEGQEPILEMA